MVTIDLTAPYFKPHKKNYQRVLRSFTEFLDLHFNFLISWVPNGAYSTYCGYQQGVFDIPCVNRFNLEEISVIICHGGTMVVEQVRLSSMTVQGQGVKLVTTR